LDIFTVLFDQFGQTEHIEKVPRSRIHYCELIEFDSSSIFSADPPNIIEATETVSMEKVLYLAT